MDRSQQLQLLHKEYLEAIRSYDFVQAKEIHQKMVETKEDYILSLYNPPEFEEERDIMFRDQREMEQRHENEEDELRAEYQDKIMELKRNQTEEMNLLAQQQAAAIEKAIRRPIPEVDSMLKQSQALALTLDFDSAIAKKEEAENKKEEVIEQRKTEVANQYEKKRKALAQNEMNALCERRDMRLEKLFFIQDQKEEAFANHMAIRDSISLKRQTDRQLLWGTVSPTCKPREKATPPRSPKTSPFSTTYPDANYPVI